MDEDEILQGVAEILGQHFHIDPTRVTRETSAADVAGWDSVNHVYVILDVERRFGLTLPVQEVFALDDVGALVRLLAGRIAER